MDIRRGLRKAATGSLAVAVLVLGVAARADDLAWSGSSSSVEVELPAAVDLLELSSFTCDDGYLNLGFSPYGYVNCLSEEAAAHYDADVDDQYQEQCGEDGGGGTGAGNDWLAGHGKAQDSDGPAQPPSPQQSLSRSAPQSLQAGLSARQAGQLVGRESADSGRPVSADSFYAPWETDDICAATCSEIHYADLAVLSLPSTTHVAVTVIHAEQKVYFDLVVGPVGDPCGLLPEHEFHVNVCYQEVGNPANYPPADEGAYLMPPLHCGADGSGDLPVGGGLRLH